MFKYFKLESYEDTLNNLAFKRTEQQKDLLSSNATLKEDYMLNYMLDYESSQSQLDIDSFAKPFDYKLNISTGSAGETKATRVDLVETFNYLIGLKVKSRQVIKEYLVIEGENLKGEKILIIWREGVDNEALNSFFGKMDFSVYDREFDTIYVNGDNNLANLKKDEDHFKVKLIEEEFKNRMFGE
jgi:adenine-specific DNA-methyltransferase